MPLYIGNLCLVFLILYTPSTVGSQVERNISSHHVVDITGRPRGAPVEEKDEEEGGEGAGAAEAHVAEHEPHPAEDTEPAAKRAKRGAGLPKPTSSATSSRQSEAGSTTTQADRSADQSQSTAPRGKSSVQGLRDLLKRSGMD